MAVDTSQSESEHKVRTRTEWVWHVQYVRKFWAQAQIDDIVTTLEMVFSLYQKWVFKRFSVAVMLFGRRSKSGLKAAEVKVKDLAVCNHNIFQADLLKA